MKHEKNNLNRIVSTIAQRIKEVRTAEGLTQEALADKVNITREYIGNIETGRRTPTFGTLSLIAKALDVDITAFFEPRPIGNPMLTKKVRIEEINKYLVKMNEQEVRMVHEIVRVIYSK